MTKITASLQTESEVLHVNNYPICLQYSPLLCMLGTANRCCNSWIVPSPCSLLSHLPPDHVITRLETGEAVICLVSLMFRRFRSPHRSVWRIRRLADARCNAAEHRGQYCRKYCRKQRNSCRRRHGGRSTRHPTPEQNHRRGPGLLSGQLDRR